MRDYLISAMCFLTLCGIGYGMATLTTAILMPALVSFVFVTLSLVLGDCFIAVIADATF